MEERRVADYFVSVGLCENLQTLDCDLVAWSDSTPYKNGYDQEPITDIGVIFPQLGEVPPDDYEVVEHTPTGLSANLNHGSLRSRECYLCFRRGRDKPPLVDIGVMYDGKEYLMQDAGVVKESVGGNVANVNNSTTMTFITYRRGHPTMPCNALVVTDICVVIASRGESPPHAFCCIDKNLNKGFVGSDVFLCYKKSMNRSRILTYNPSAISRYPMNDLENFPFPSTVPMFCLPMGASLEVWPREATRPKPTFSTFVLTVSDAKHKVYGSALTFYEEYPEEKLTRIQTELLKYEPSEEYNLHTSKSICVLSHWPFSDTFKQWLHFLYDIVTSEQPQATSIERYIVQLLEEVPFPSPRTVLQPSADFSIRLIMTQPEDLPIPRSAAGFKDLLVNLRSENSMLLMLLALTEQKILIHSLRSDTLTAVGEAVSSMLFPFKWQCPYIPLCPLGLVEVLHAPLPFLIGVDSRFFDLYEPPADVTCVDLDTNIITVSEAQRQHINLRLLPKKPAKTLKATLDRLYLNLVRPNKDTSLNRRKDCDEDPLEMEFNRRRRDQALELEIQESFLRFTASILKGYRSFLLPIVKAPTVGTTDPEALFQINDFLKSRDRSHQKFFQLLITTQMFIRFIEERSFVADGDHGLAFFDECTERLSSQHDDDEIRLLEADVAHTSERTVFVLPPEPSEDSNGFIYNEFKLNPQFLKGTRKKRDHLSLVQQQHVTPGSPMARRTKHEIKSAQKLAKKYVRHPSSWARCLSGTCHTLYFMTLPSLVSLNVGRERAVLQQSYDLLVRATQQKLVCDEICYRLMMQLCGQLSKPLYAVKLLLLMKKNGIQPNAVTYGLYNRCVLEAEWPAHSSTSLLLWNKLRYVVLGAARFRRAAKRRAARRQSVSKETGSTTELNQGDRVASRSSLDSHEAVDGGVFDRFYTRVSSIVKGSMSNGSEQTDSGVSLRDPEVDDPDCCDQEYRADVEAEAEAETEAEVAAEAEAEAETEEVVPEDVHISFTPPVSPSEYMRILSRSESAGDASIIDKLQQNNNNKTCSRSLQFTTEEAEEDEVDECLTVENQLEQTSNKISRTVITENDPLGALDAPTTPPPSVTPPPEPFSNQQTPSIEIPTDDVPILFKNCVHRSATFEGSPPTGSKLHRSETVPAATVASSLASLGSSIKMSFGRYSPAKLSLKKSDLKVSQHIMETINHFSPSSLTSRKSNEFIQGGLSSLKSAANTMAKKLDEIKEAISTSTTSTPVKGQSGDRLAAGDLEAECESTDGSEGGERQRKISAEFPCYKGSYANLGDFDDVPDQLFPTAGDSSNAASEMDIFITSCSQCHNCSSLIYDEDIMANWSADDSNLNSVCQVCKKSTVPLLTIRIKAKDEEASKPFSVPYLNPLVLRKELENVLSREGDLSLASEKFVEEHPIIYWNLVWSFERINVQTHLPNLCLKSRSLSRTNSDSVVLAQPVSEQDNSEKKDEDPIEKDASVMQPVEEGTDPLTQELALLEHLTALVRVQCMWDDPQLHGDKPPMYVLWEQKGDQEELQSDSVRFMKDIVKSVRYNDLVDPLKKLAQERQRSQQQRSGPPASEITRSIYRELLFLSCKEFGRALQLNVFDKTYANDFSKITEKEKSLLGPQDWPLSASSIYCRQYFKPLMLP